MPLELSFARMSRALPLLLLGLAGCGDGGSSGDGDGDADTDADSDADTDSDSGTGGNGFHLGTFDLATFAIPFEDDYPGGTDTALPSCSGGVPIATVPSDFAAVIATEGVGKLHDGRIVVLGMGGGCYDVSATEWGLGSSGRPLVLFRSVSVHTGSIALGRWLWIPQLEGATLPGEDLPHDGCVRVDDDSRDAAVGAFLFFIGLESNRDAVVAAVGAAVDAYQDSPSCFGWEGA
jgi:hypothetical protein